MTRGLYRAESDPDGRSEAPYNRLSAIRDERYPGASRAYHRRRDRLAAVLAGDTEWRHDMMDDRWHDNRRISRMPAQAYILGRYRRHIGIVMPYFLAYVYAPQSTGY